MLKVHLASSLFPDGYWHHPVLSGAFWPSYFLCRRILKVDVMVKAEWWWKEDTWGLYHCK